MKERLTGLTGNKTDYWNRGKRKNKGGCRICGELQPKQNRMIKRKVGSVHQDVFQVFVKCKYPHHGETIIYERVN